MNYRDLVSKVTIFLFFWSSFLLPLKTTLSNLGIIVLLVVSAISFFINGLSTKPLGKPFMYLGTTIALYIPMIIGSFYGSSLEEVSLQLQKNLFYITVPFLLLRRDIDLQSVIKWTGIGLVFGCCLAILYLITLNIVAFIHAGLPAHQVFSYDFTGIAFVKPLKEMHPVYLGSYCLFACVLLWSKLLLPKGLKICFTCILLAGIVFLNSRSIYFLSILILLISLFSVLSIKRAILLLVAAIVFFFLIHPVIKSTYVYNKMVYGTFWELRENVAKKNINKDVLADSRMSRWLISIDLIKEKPVFGHGTGESRDLLKQRYQERGMKASYVQAYDSHNQYLGYALDYGLLGLLFLCGFFFLNIRAAVLNKDLNMFLLIFMLGWVCLFENYLIRNMGINFVSLFLLIFHLKHNE